MLLRFKIDITQLTKRQLLSLRRWLLVAIVGVMFMQSILTALLLFSIDHPASFQESYSKSEQAVSTQQQKIKQQLLSLLDFGQEPTKKKQASLHLHVFNLFVEEVAVEVPPCLPSDVSSDAFFSYLDGKGLLFHQKIPHPPRTV